MSIFELLKEYEPYHSSFQLQHFVIIRNGQTLYGCYKQVLRELAARIPPVLQSCQKVMRALSVETDLNVDLVAGISRLELIEIRDLIREFSLLSGYALALKERLGELSTSERAELEMDYWKQYTKSLMARDMIAEGRLTASTVDMIFALPLAEKRDILPYLTDPCLQNTLVNWYLEHECSLPEPKLGGFQAALQLISEGLNLGEHDRRKLLRVACFGDNEKA